MSALLQIEAGATPFAMGALTDSGDHKTFTSEATLFSQLAGFAPVVRPDGVATGLVVSIAASGSDDVVDVSGGTCYLAGVKTTVTADTDIALTRAVSTDTHIINSITIDDTGAIVVVAGTDSTAFTETRGAAGGPPFIPVGSIELAQVRMSSNVAAAVVATEIFALPGTHREPWDYPLFEADIYSGSVVFYSPLAASHTGGVTKAVNASYGKPEFNDLDSFSNVKLPEVSESSSTEQTNDRGPQNSKSQGLTTGGFDKLLKNGVTDPIRKLLGVDRWIKYFPDKNATPYALVNGSLSMTTTWASTGSPKAPVTIIAKQAAVFFDE